MIKHNLLSRWFRVMFQTVFNSAHFGEVSLINQTVNVNVRFFIHAPIHTHMHCKLDFPGVLIVWSVHGQSGIYLDPKLNASVHRNDRTTKSNSRQCPDIAYIAHACVHHGKTAPKHSVVATQRCTAKLR